jgi:hypothetical protein
LAFRRLVPLRIPSGWAVVFNNFVDLEAPARLSPSDRDAYLGQDLLAIRSMAPETAHTAGHALYVGWFPERDPAGAYTLTVDTASDTTGIELTSPHAEVIRDAVELCLNRLNEGAGPEAIQGLIDEATRGLS